MDAREEAPPPAPVKPYTNIEMATPAAADPTDHGGGFCPASLAHRHGRPCLRRASCARDPSSAHRVTVASIPVTSASTDRKSLFERFAPITLPLGDYDIGEDFYDSVPLA